ncbi:MAG: hypothetical protein HUJ89_02255 [Bacteroidales bacterium]|nr:hypothetical protein [Bacteroidales bacterium]
MKSIKLSAISAFAAIALVACQPALIKGPSIEKPIDAKVIADGISYTQWADEACTVPQEDGNWIKYTTSPAKPIQIYLVDEASLAEKIVAAGASGVFQLKPKRGASPEQTFFWRFLNQDGSMIGGSVDATVFVPGELDPEILLLASNKGEKVWKWNLDGNGIWGNCASTGVNTGTTIPDAVWWGINETAGFADQGAHFPGGVVTGDANDNAYMIFGEDLSVASYTAERAKLRSASFSVEGYSEEVVGFAHGKLVTDGEGILMPWDINGNGTPAPYFWIYYLTPSELTLMSDKGGASAPGAWAECTWWRFASGSDYEGLIANNDKGKTWKWNLDGNGVWGNCGSTGANTGTSVLDGVWWASPTADALQEGQEANFPGGVVTGDASDGAYMVFTTTDVTSYDKDGNVLRSSDWVMEEWNNLIPEGGFYYGKMVTGSEGILMPWDINGKGTPAPYFYVMYLSGKEMTLMSDKGGASAPGAWDECTWWRFAAAE